MLKGTTPSGFDFEISDDAQNDYELLELLADVEENPTLVPKIVKRLLGDEQRKKLLDHVRNENGIASVTAVSDELRAIMTTGSAKNS